MKPLKGKRVLITGGTGSLGKTLVKRLLTGEMGQPAKIIVFSRDEAKQYFMRLEFQHRAAATDEITYRDFQQVLEFRIGDIRDFGSIASALRDADVVINAAAMKQVPICEYFPAEAVKTNILGAENIVRAIQEHTLLIETVVGISTDKACKPVNAMGMTKAIQERVFIQGNMRCPGTRFVCVRYGNVLASRGSVIPLFHEQIAKGGPVSITTLDMTRFLLSLDDAVDTVFAAIRHAQPGEIFVPRAPSARVVDIATALIGDRPVEQVVTGIRPGEKIHEILVSDEEAHRTVERGRWYAVLPMLPEVCGDNVEPRCLSKEHSSADKVMTIEETAALLKTHQLMLDDGPAGPVPAFVGSYSRELLR
jgi:FlaA1/EpsC-like NDP-sugar epimerase